MSANIRCVCAVMCSLFAIDNCTYKIADTWLFSEVCKRQTMAMAMVTVIGPKNDAHRRQQNLFS